LVNESRFNQSCDFWWSNWRKEYLLDNDWSHSRVTSLPSTIRWEHILNNVLFSLLYQLNSLQRCLLWIATPLDWLWRWFVLLPLRSLLRLSFFTFLIFILIIVLWHQFTKLLNWLQIRSWVNLLNNGLSWNLRQYLIERI
jgi:hypothetical protein